MHEDVIHDCLLGCANQKDSLSHYIFCPHVYAMLRFLFIEVSEDPLVRLGLKHTCALSLKVLSCTFSAYHALKAEVRGGRINLQSGNRLRLSWGVFANTIKVEAGEMSLDTRAYSHPKFIAFLLSGGEAMPSLSNSSTHDSQ